MIENKRFIIKGDRSFIDSQTKLIYDLNDFTGIINVVEGLNKLYEENEQLKSDNFNLNKTVEYLDKIVKEQCNKIDWADECGVRWEEEYKEWIGDD